MIPNRMYNQPIQAQRTRRQHPVRVLTSMQAGKCMPVYVMPLLREDAANFQLDLSFEQQETVEILLNAVNVDVHCILVPNLALERFTSMDELNRSYKKELGAGGSVIPYFMYEARGAIGTDPIHEYLGKHGKATDQINMAYIHAYNMAWNWRAKNVSPNIALRDIDDRTLAPAFWSHNDFKHVVPDFDAATMEGEVALNVVNQQLPVKGIGFTGAVQSRTSQNIRETGGATTTYPQAYGVVPQSEALAAGKTWLAVNAAGATAGIPAIFAELAENGITVSMANLEMARKTQAFANWRKRYSEISEEYLLDLLMDGIRVPEYEWRQPILLKHEHTIMGMAKRYASDGASLTDSVVNGAAGLQIRVSVPPVPCGGVLIVTAEISPEQLFERQEDPYLHCTDHDTLPAYLRDYLDPQKVQIVRNRRVDIDHSMPDDVFGYEEMNAQWNSAGPCIGGRFLRPTVDAGFDSDRQAIWAVEVEDPVLSEDFYLVADMHLKPFYTSNIDPFDVIGRGGAVITGLTQFGGQLIEATGNDYQAVLDKVDQTRIEE